MRNLVIETLKKIYLANLEICIFSERILALKLADIPIWYETPCNSISSKVCKQLFQTYNLWIGFLDWNHKILNLNIWQKLPNIKCPYRPILYPLLWALIGNKNKVNGNGTGLAWEYQSHCFADGFLITDAHSFGTDTHTWL